MSASGKGRMSSSEHTDSDENIARKKERLDDTIFKLKGKVACFSDDEMARDDTDKEKDDRNNVSLQDTLSPRCTSIILKLAKENDEIERSNSTSQREKVIDSNILQNSVTKGDKIFLPSEIITSKKRDSINMNKESSNETNENRKVVNTESKLASFSDVQNEENISLQNKSLQQIKVQEVKDIEPTVEEDTTTKLPTSTAIEDENEKDVHSLDNMEHNVSVEAEKSQMNFKLSEENLVNFSLTSTADKLARRINRRNNKELKSSPKDTVIKKRQRTPRRRTKMSKLTETSDNQINLKNKDENLKVAEENISPASNYSKPVQISIRKSKRKCSSTLLAWSKDFVVNCPGLSSTGAKSRQLTKVDNSPNKTSLNLLEPLEPSDNEMKSSESDVPNLTEKTELFTVVNSNCQSGDFFASSVHMQEIIDKETDTEALDETDGKKEKRKLVDINSDSENLLSSAKKCFHVNSMLETIHSPPSYKLQSDSSNKMNTPMKNTTSQLTPIISPKTSNETVKKTCECLNANKMMETTHSPPGYKVQLDSNNKLNTPMKDETSQLEHRFSPETLSSSFSNVIVPKEKLPMEKTDLVTDKVSVKYVDVNESQCTSAYVDEAVDCFVDYYFAHTCYFLGICVKK